MTSGTSFKVHNPVNKNKKSLNNPSFGGHVLTQDNRGNDIYKFHLPNAPSGTKLHLAIMSMNQDGDFKVAQEQLTKDMPEGFDSLSIKASDLNIGDRSFLGYKFTINGKEYTDKGVRGDRNYTIAIPLKNANSKRSRQMEHVMVDSFNVKVPGAAKRNHFNMLGGSLKSLVEKLDFLSEQGIRNIIGTPIFGQDNKSSHGYWTTNPYQITNNLGNFKDFSNLMIEMYKRGMSWTADGAFVNEGIEGCHIKDICNWGIESPFVTMFETKDIANVPVRFGVLSKNNAVNKHLHIKLVNAPYKINFVKGDDSYREAKVSSCSYDETKPTYIQLFDDRLASEEQMNDNKSIFDVYDLKEDADRLAIACSKDSVQPLHFRVSPMEVKLNYRKHREARKNNKNTEFKNQLTQWSKFSIVNSNKDGGVSLWVGNNDISKKRFLLPEHSLKTSDISKEKRAEVIAAINQVQDDTVQVGKYWTSSVANLLTEYTAKELQQRVSQSGLTNKSIAYQNAIEDMVQEGKLHKDAKMIFEKNGEKYSPLENMLAVSPVNNQRKYSLKAKELQENVTSGLMFYPLDAIEFSPDVMSVFAYPFIKNLAVTEDTIGVNRYDLFKKGDEYYNKMPQAYRQTYQLMDNLYANEMTQKATSILKEVEQISGKKLFAGEDLTQEGREIFTLLANDITKFLVVSSLAPTIKPLPNNDMLEYNLADLAKVDLNSLNLQFESTPEDTAKLLISKIKNGLNSIPTELEASFVKMLSDRVVKMDSDSINVAKLIVEKTESGLDWRIDAAKDVGDWENLEAERFDSEKNKDGILGFWNKFNTNVRKYNPRSYIIGELTDWHQMNKQNFIQKSGFTTMSDYEFFFSTLPALYGQNDEGSHYDDFAGTIYDRLNKYFDSGIVDNLNFQHRFVGNQDKPRIGHLMSVDVNAFNANKGGVVRQIMQKAIESTPEYKEMYDGDRAALIDALNNLQEGFHTVSGKNKTYDPENFGIRPFDFVIEDIVNDAIANNPNFRNYAKANPDKVKYLKANTLKGMLEGLSKYRSILFAMVGLPGTPTNYAGDEFGQTGWETFCKNEKQENRNAVRWDWLENSNYDFIKQFYEKDIKPVLNIRNKEAASALVNGTTQPLNAQKLNEGGTAVAFYRYNDKTDAIVVLHGKGYGAKPHEKGEDVSLSKIDLGGLVSGLPKGAIYRNALNNERYKVCDNGYEIKKLADDGNNTLDKIPLGNAGIILLREKDFNGKKLSFKGVANPNVILANLKYNIH